MTPEQANACRFTPSRQGHVESYFLRANDPKRPRAFWLKATILAPIGSDPVAECWCIWFEGESQRSWAHRATYPLTAATFPGHGSSELTLPDATYSFGASGRSQGQLTRADRGACSWNLGWESVGGLIGEPLSIFPFQAMVDGPFPKSKLLTPAPALRLSGTVTCFSKEVSVDGWLGMQGHNWGREHASEYAWGQCLFPDANGKPETMLEGFTGRTRVGGRESPRLSALIVRSGVRTFRFDSIVDLWRQEAEIGEAHWNLKMRGADGVAELKMNAGGRPMVCLGYQNPDGRMSYCFNSKLAATHLRISPRSGAPFERYSPHGGALEFLRGAPDARFVEVI
jgi:hypothetical protein